MKGSLPPRALRVAMLLVCAVCPLPHRVQAQEVEDPAPAAVTLQWTRDEGATACPAGVELARELDARMGRSVLSAPAAAQRFIEGRVTGDPERGYEAAIRLFEADGQPAGERVLRSEDPTCEELAEAMLVVLGVMIDPEAAMLPPPAAAEPPEAAEPPQQPPAAAADAEADAEAAPAPPQPRHALGLLGRLSTHALPEPTLGFGLEYAYQLPRRVLLRLDAVASTEVPVEDEVAVEQRGSHLRLFTLGAHACPTLFEARGVGGGLCGGVEAGLLQQDGFGNLDAAQSALLPTLHAVAGARLRWQTQWVRVSLGVAFVALLVRRSLEIDGGAGNDVPLFEQPTFSADVDMAVAVRF